MRLPTAPPAAEVAEDLEVDLLLEALARAYGHDFTGYVRAHITRRLRRRVALSGLATISQLLDRALRDHVLAARVLGDLSISTTEMFRDPAVYLAFREHVVPHLATYARLRIWHAGCSTGEEVYSMAILLAEEGLADRTTIYATDFNEASVARAIEGIYPAERMRTYTRNYQLAGGRRSLSEYYRARHGSAVLDAGLRRRIVFSSHNLATDESIGEMHAIVCRNVFIYFGRHLQDRVLDLFRRSLVRRGFLCLGAKEHLLGTVVAEDFETLRRGERIFRLRGPVDEEDDR